MKNLILILVLVPVLSFSQTRKQRKALAAKQKADQQIINNFKSHIQNLTNNNSALKDASQVQQYIINQFKIIGLQPKGTDGYLQHFKIDFGKQVKTGTFLKVNGTLLAVAKDYVPLAYSAQKSVAGMPAMALRERGVPWFEDVKEWLDDNSKNPAFDINKRVQKETARAAAKGATALFLYNSGDVTDNLHLNSKDKTTPLPVPVVYITSQAYKKYFNDQSQVLDIELNVAFEETVKNADNIAGYIDNSAASNIIIAAPYKDFFKEENLSITDIGKTKDSVDIVSGTSMLIELARMLAISKTKNNNYTFLAYSGQDLMSQSGKWLNSPDAVSSVNYVINLSNVGIFGEGKKLLIKSYGTSPEMIKPLINNTLEIILDSSQIQNKDTSLHYARVPEFDFFAGNNNNFKKDLQIGDKINYEEELSIARFIYQLIEVTGTKGKIVFAEK